MGRQSPNLVNGRPADQTSSSLTKAHAYSLDPVPDLTSDCCIWALPSAPEIWTRMQLVSRRAAKPETAFWSKFAGTFRELSTEV